ncbi:hypothetical protein GCM10010842_30230 [Deinococcus daejeonensis]|uniref:AAA+ ATPase domain-containing protein n=1 Tax=Deinococcus daejeonensis TaxID=1007098 RepID=A0ABQ2JE48_9DEIO|nr:hypothetical protein GCM10010842_30230 [Deinococcus daejeonensis]
MLNHHTVWEIRVKMSEALESIARPKYWDTSRDIKGNFDYNSTRIAFLISAADSDLSYEERSVFNYVFDTEYSHPKFERMALEFVGGDLVDIISEIPDYFVSAVLFDSTEREEFSQLAYNYVKCLCVLFLSISGEGSESKAALIYLHLKSLKNYAARHHVFINDDLLPDIQIETDTQTMDTGVAKNSILAPIAQEKINKPELIPEENSQEEADDIDSLLTELDSLIGLSNVKSDVKSLTNLIRVQRLRESRGLSVAPMSLHLVFTGNPGTGKTTVARLLGKIYKSLGILSQGHLIEVDRSGLVAGFVGQTAIKTKEIASKANGGILFIDEAYSLYGSENDYGKEAIETLLKHMEDNRHDFILIVAGYNDQMERFLSSNPGLRSRFNKFLAFNDYNRDEMTQIFLKFSKEAGYLIDDEALRQVVKFFDRRIEITGNAFSNARDARNAFEYIIAKQADRVINHNLSKNDDIIRIVEDDVNSLSML